MIYTNYIYQVRGLTSIVDCVNASIKRFEDYIKKIKERLIIAASNSIGKIRQRNNEN